MPDKPIHPLLTRAIPAAEQLYREEHFSLENLCHALDCSLRELAEAVGSVDEMVLHVNDHFMAAYQALAAKVDQQSADDAEAIKRLSQLWLDYGQDNIPLMKVLLQHKWSAGFERPDWYMARVAACFTPIEARLRKLAPKAPPELVTAAARGIYAQICGLHFLSVNDRATPAGIASRQKVLELNVGWVIKGLQG
jgi:hypothetical protein